MRAGSTTAWVAWVLAIVLAFAHTATAGSVTFPFSGNTIPDDDSGIEPSVEVSFSWDDACLVGCTLRIDLDYLDSNGGLGLESNAQGLSGAIWDMSGATLRDNDNQTGADVISPTLVGGLSATAIGQLSNITIDSVSGEQTTAHWGVRNDLAILYPSSGTNILSSVGDVMIAGMMSVDFMGVDSLLPGGTISSVEPNPPDGIPFAIVDPFTPMLTGIAGDVALAQSTTTAFLIYDGALTGVGNVEPLFGTSGVALPEAGTGLMLGLGIAGLLRRRPPA